MRVFVLRLVPNFNLYARLGLGSPLRRKLSTNYQDNILASGQGRRRRSEQTELRP